MIIIDKLAYSSPLRHKSPGLKVLFSMTTLLLCVWARSAVFSSFILAAMSCLAVGYGGAAFRRYLKLLAVPLGFLLPSTLGVVVQLSPQPQSVFAWYVGVGYLTTSPALLHYGGTLLLTALAAISCMYFMALTTPVTDMITVLRRARCPLLLLELMFLIYRFIFILLETAAAIATAQKCRLGNRDFKTKLRAAAALLAVLLQRAMHRSSLLYTAMEARCYNGHIRVLTRTVPAARLEKAAVAATLLLLGVLAALCKRYGGL